MSDRPDDRTQRDAAEAKLVFSRIKELYEHPIRGPLDLDHLRAVHAHIFQDLPQHRRGEVRGDTSGWSKNRLLEGSNSVHEVHYAHEGVADRIRTTLRDLGGPASLKGLDPTAFASRMATWITPTASTRAIRARCASSPAPWPWPAATSWTGPPPTSPRPSGTGSTSPATSRCWSEPFPASPPNGAC